MTPIHPNHNNGSRGKLHFEQREDEVAFILCWSNPSIHLSNNSNYRILEAHNQLHDDIRLSDAFANQISAIGWLH